MTPTIVSNHIQTTLKPVIKKLISPENLSTLVTKLPFLVNQTIIEKLSDKVFQEQINEGEFEFLEDRTLQIELLDAQLNIGLTSRKNKICCSWFTRKSNHSDVTLSINSFDAISLIQQEVDPDTLFFQRKLKIRGDTELAHHIKNTIDTLNPELIPNLIMTIINEYKKQLTYQ